MATVKNITLDEAVQKAKSTNGTSYLWIVHENVLDLEIPEDHSFDSIGVVWKIFNEHCTAAVNLPSNKEGVLDAMRPLKEDNSPFDNLEELRQAYPKLFEVKGDFRILTR